MHTIIKFYSLIGTMLFTTLSFAGGGGGGVATPNKLLSICTVSEVVYTKSVPTGKHRSFSDALKINQSFVVGQSFNLLGGYYSLNDNGSFLGIYSVQQRITPTGHPIFYHWELPSKASLILKPTLSLRQSTFHIKTATNIFEKDLPVINNVMLVVEAKNSILQFRVIWNYNDNWNSMSPKPIVTTYGKMNCLIP